MFPLHDSSTHLYDLIVLFSFSLSFQVKSAFTRTYNKECHLTPYATGNLTKKKRGGGGGGTELEGLEGEDGEAAVNAESDEEEQGLSVDSMIKVDIEETYKNCTYCNDKMSRYCGVPL